MISASPKSRLDPDSFVPLYRQLSQVLRTGIQDGKYREGDRLPSERELVSIYEVSRITVKSALEELVQSGLAYRKAGLGTFVARPKITGLSGFLSFSEDMRNRSMAPSSRILRMEFVPAGEAAAVKLNISPSELCLRLERLRLADGEPVAIEDAYIPASLCPGIEKHDLEKGSLFETLVNRYGIKPVWAEGIIEAVSANRAQAEHLAIRNGAPVLLIHRVTYNEKISPIEWVQSIYRSDRFSFSTGRQMIKSNFNQDGEPVRVP